MPQGFYKGFAEFANKQGYHCLTFDYRGTGQSQNIAKRDIQLHHWGTLDIDAAIAKATELCDTAHPKLHYIGHSIGGQLLGLAPNATQLNSITLAAASQPHWSRGNLAYKTQLALVGHMMLPLGSIGREEFPCDKLGIASMNIPANCARSWGRWIRKRDYLFHPKFKLDTQGYQALTQPLLAWTVSDDAMAPYQAIEALRQRYPNTESEHRIADAGSLGLGVIGHMGFFRRNAEQTLWQQTFDWINQH
ncbi:MAG: alpha/beta fold hydrolase [Candidatus Pelagadaptatus aseana]